MQYLRAAKDLLLIIEGDDSRVVKWWVRAAFAVHKDMRSHSCGMVSLGVGAVYAGFAPQKLNTKISTESELIGANDFMPQVVWNRYFLQYQGYDVRKNVMYQDNQSSIMFKNNGKGSSSKRMRHINICYFFFTDRIASVHLDMDHFPT